MFEISTRIGCRLNCRFCPQQKIISNYLSDVSRPSLMSFETFTKCLNKIPTTETIVFSGMAEPWLNPDCTRMMNFAHAKGHKLNIFTTLVGMTIEDYEALKKTSPELLCLHIPDKDGNAKFPDDENFWSILNQALLDIHSHKLFVTSFSCHGAIHPRICNQIEKIGIPIINEMHDRAGNLSDPLTRHKSCL